MKKNYLERAKKYRLLHNFSQIPALKCVCRQIVLGETINYFSPTTKPRQEVAVLVHGLFHSGAVMVNFAEYLAQHGYQVAVYDYRTTQGDYWAHAGKFKDFLHNLAIKYGDCRISLITHSMGGILARIAFSNMQNWPFAFERLHRVVMLAPPHRGSEVAKFYSDFMPRLSQTFIKPLKGLSNAPDSPIHGLPWPEKFCEVGVITGRYDRYVAKESAQVPGQVDELEMPCGHSFMMFNPQIFYQTCHFLEYGSFDHGKKV